MSSRIATGSFFIFQGFRFLISKIRFRSQNYKRWAVGIESIVQISGTIVRKRSLPGAGRKKTGPRFRGPGQALPPGVATSPAAENVILKGIYTLLIFDLYSGHLPYSKIRLL